MSAIHQSAEIKNIITVKYVKQLTFIEGCYSPAPCAKPAFLCALILTNALQASFSMNWKNQCQL